MKRKIFCVFVLAAVALVQLNCATKKQVRKEVDRIDQEMDTIESSVEANETRLREHDAQISGLSKETQEALDRAKGAEKLALGKLLYEVTLSDEDVTFALDKAEVNEKSRTVLDELLAQLKADNRNIYIEIQGHTDGMGSDDYNMRLGLARAEAVRRYLSENGIPLHRMSTISYGESRPVASNKNRAGRSQNRRVVILVLE